MAKKRTTKYPGFHTRQHTQSNREYIMARAAALYEIRTTLYTTVFYYDREGVIRNFASSSIKDVETAKRVAIEQYGAVDENHIIAVEQISHMTLVLHSDEKKDAGNAVARAFCALHGYTLSGLIGCMDNNPHMYNL